MMLLQPIELDDLDEVEEFAHTAGKGLSTLPRDREILKQKIKASNNALKSDCKEPHGELYLFILRDLEKNRAAGISGILSKTGADEPFYSYLWEVEEKSCKDISLEDDVGVLYPMVTRDGPSEICTLFMRPEYRKSGLGPLLSYSRFLFIACHPERFEDCVIAELRGVIDEKGKSPFWESLGKRFFHMDFAKADSYSTVNKQFIKELLPDHPIYTKLLSQKAQEVLGQPHRNTYPALRLLKKQGFEISHEIDIFDAGPKVTAMTKDIKTIRESISAEVKEVTKTSPHSEKMLLCNRDLNFRACYGEVELLPDGGAIIKEEVAEALNIKVGKKITFAPLTR